MELSAIADGAKACTRCALHEGRTNVVFGEGDPNSPLVLVGEGPGEQEDLTGRPFVGRAGQLLDKALSDCGLSRGHVYICNTVKCRACERNEGRARNRPPTPEEVASCRHWLVPQLETIAPKAILCIGAPSAKNLIKPDFKITKERGKYFPCSFAQVAMATLHPAYVLRRQSATDDGGYALIVKDIGRAWAAANELREKASTEGQPEQVDLFSEVVPR